MSVQKFKELFESQLCNITYDYGKLYHQLINRRKHMPLKKFANSDAFDDEEGQPHYTFKDVGEACPQAATDWVDDYGEGGDDYYFCVCYEELCAYPNDPTSGEGMIWNEEVGWSDL